MCSQTNFIGSLKLKVEGMHRGGMSGTERKKMLVDGRESPFAMFLEKLEKAKLMWPVP